MALELQEDTFFTFKVNVFKRGHVRAHHFLRSQQTADGCSGWKLSDNIRYHTAESDKRSGQMFVEVGRYTLLV